MNLLRRLVRWGLGDVDARVFLSEMEELSRSKEAVAGRDAARRWRRKETIRIGLYAMAAGIRRMIAPARSQECPLWQVSSKPGVGAALHTVPQDVRYSFRTLRRRPLFATVAVLTLGLGIGAATAMFSVVDAVLLKGLRYRGSGRLVTVWQVVPGWRDVINISDYWDKAWLAFEQYRAWMASGNGSMDLAIFEDGEMTLTGAGHAERLAVGETSASLPRVLGVQPMLGRWFLREEEGTEGTPSTPVCVLSYELWQRRFGGDPNVIGTTLTASERSYTIVGIMPAGFRLRMLTVKGDDGKRDVWVPLDADGGYHWEAVARLASGLSIEQAETAARAVLLPAENPSGVSVRLVPRKESEVLGFGTPLLLLLSATGLLLLIACANIATLSLGEVLGRRREIATRLALGAPRRRVARQLITESAILGVLGSAIGVPLAVAATRLLVVLAPPVPRIEEVGVDIRVLAFAVFVGVTAGLLFGTVPALLSTRGAVGATLGVATRGSTVRRERLSRSLLVGEVALTVVVLVASGLLARSLLRLTDVNPGFNATNVVAIHALLPPSNQYASEAERGALWEWRKVLTESMVARMRAVPGVVSAASANGLPFFDHTSSYQIRVEGGGGALGEGVTALGYRVSPGYFDVMGIALLAGAGFTNADRPGGPLAGVVSEAMALRCWPGRSPIGGRFRFRGGMITVVGVARDVRHEALDRDPVSTFYVPDAQHESGDANFVVRTAAEPRHMIPLLREAIWSVDRDAAIVKAGTMTDFVSQSAAYQRYATLLTVVFGSVAVLLAAAGVFGVTARDVAQRTREMGIRLALGAQGRTLVGSTVGAGLLTSVVGVGIGLLGAVWASRLLSRFLFGVAATDPLTYGTVAMLVVAVGLMSCYVPARRISQVDPVSVLRAE